MPSSFRPGWLPRSRTRSRRPSAVRRAARVSSSQWSHSARSAATSSSSAASLMRCASARRWAGTGSPRSVVLATPVRAGWGAALGTAAPALSAEVNTNDDTRVPMTRRSPSPSVNSRSPRGG
ncbi:hypothetical protein ACFC4C_38480 [Streptomyces sp. NPDC056039]|uniref:hypothetical protein n=1 Tax=Streptomyces sp. NPDC056039 TaxID=3345687 RepID=UPI0035E2350A